MSDNVTVYGSFHFSESCTFDPNKNLILAMNAGNRGDTGEDDGYVSLINPDGSVHTPKWIGATRDGLELHDPLGSAISSGVLYTVDSGHVRQFDLQSGRPLRSVPVPGSTLLNGIAVADDGTVYASNTRPVGQIWKVTRFLHDCRRTAARNLIRANVPERIAMLLTGHKSRAIFDRYNIIHEQELLDAGDQLVEYLAQQAQAVPARRRPHPVRTAGPRIAPPLRLVRRTTA